MSDQGSGGGRGRGADPIAIVGAGCRLPGAVRGLEELFETLEQGRDCITEVPPDRWDVDAYYDPDPVTPGRTYVRRGGFVSEVDRFDAGFFGISDAEAARMDPQQRMVLETVWHALEDAGQSPDQLMNSPTGVFVAMMNTNGYSQLKVMFEGLSGITAFDAMGDAMSITGGRIAHFLGLEGPCLTLDTACSSSLVALHLARQSILAGECDSAIVAGVGAILHPGIHMAFSKVGLMSREGRCAAFDASADGYVRGEGCVAVVLRRESQAVLRGDRILASIVSTAVNQDGQTPAVTAPNGRAQESVMRMALARSGVSPNEVGYVEAHGTGTPVGDPIEMSAIANVFGPGRPEGDTLYVGSVKSNFGHIEAGAGLLGLVKAALSLDREEILPSLHFEKLNPNIDLSHVPVTVPTQPIPWRRDPERQRLAGVNSFGYSGTNAHALLQEAPAPSAAGRDGAAARPYELVVLSAKTAAGLEDLVDRWAPVLDHDEVDALPDVAFTAATGRAHLAHRLAVVARDAEEVAEKLQAWRDGRKPRGLSSGRKPAWRKPKIAFVFTGQGAQYAGMAKELYDTEPRFKAALDRCAQAMEGELDQPLLEVLFGESSAELLSSTTYVQPALFAVEYALADQLAHWGIEPDYVIGHSVGELVAATVAGMLDLDDAARFVVARGRLMGGLPAGGAMLALDATREEASGWIAGRESELSVATVNGPRSVVVAGTEAAVEAIAERAEQEGRRAQRLEVSHAFHSPLMDPILDQLSEVAGSMRLQAPKVPIVSNVTGDFVGDDTDGRYWSSHVRQSVLFHQGIERIVESGCAVVLEVGPHPALMPAVASAFDTDELKCVPTLRRDKKDVRHLLEAMAALYAVGVPLDFDQMFWRPSYRRVSLPLYPFRRDRHWLRADTRMDSPPDALGEEPMALPEELHPLLGEASEVGARRVVFRSQLAASSPWTDHRVLGNTVFPGTGYLDMAARAFAAAAGEGFRPAVLRDVVFERPLVLSYGQERTVEVTLDTSANGAVTASFLIAARDDDSVEPCCRGRIEEASGDIELVSLEEELAGRGEELPIGPFYGQLREGGLEYGARFSNVRQLWLGQPGSGEAFGRVSTALPGQESRADALSQVALLDGCLHLFGAALRRLGDDDEFQGAYVPAGLQALTLRAELPAEVWSHVSIRTNNDGRAAVAEVRVLNDEGEVVAEMEGLELRRKGSLDAAGAPVAAAEDTSFSREELIAQLRDQSREQRIGVLSEWLAAEVKATVGQAAEDLDLDDIHPSTAFLEIGLDSLLVTELQRRIQEKLDFRFQPMEAMDYQSIESLADYILDDVLAGLLSEVPAAETPSIAAPDPASGSPPN